MLLSGFAGGRSFRLALLLVALTILVCGTRRLPLAGWTLFLARFFRARIRFAQSAGIRVALLFLLLLPTHPLCASDVTNPKRVLILYSFDPEQGVYVGFDDALRSRLRAGLPDRIEFYTEYLDLARFPDPGHAKTLVKLLRLRLAGKKPDLIMPMGYAALDFLLNSGKDLFPNTPIVTIFNERKPGEGKLGPEERSLVTGMKTRDELARTLDLALQLQPDTQRVVVVVGNSANDRFWAEQLRTDLAGYEGRVTFTYLTDLPMDRLLKQLTGLPPHTIIFYGYFLQDASGQFFLREEALDLIAKASNVPIYGFETSFLGHGVVGGCVEDPAATGTAVADMAVRVLSGEKPADIPMVIDSSNRNEVDWRQLKRWRISKSRLPPGTVVLFRNPSVWDRYRPLIIGSLFLVIVEAFFILALLVEREGRRRAEERLLSEKAFSDAVIESLPGIFSLQDETHKNIRWNRNAEKFLRYHPSQVQQLGNVPEKLRDRIREKVREARETHQTVDFEVEVLGQGGTNNDYQFTVQSVQLEGRQYVVAAGIDISKRKQAEAELRLSEARFSSAFEYAPIGMSLVAPDGRFFKVNRALCDMLGYTAEELLMKTVQDITPADDWESDLSQVRRMLAGEISSYQLEKRNLQKSGRVVWIWLSVSLVRDNEGQPVYFVSQIQDITERKRAEEELKDAEERFAKAFHSSPEGCAIATLRERRFIEANDAFLRMTGYERSEVIGTTVDDLRLWPDPGQRESLMKKISEGGRVREEDVCFRTKSGKILQVRMSAEIIQLQNESCLLGLARDVTEQNLLEEQFRQAQKMEAVGRLAGGVAHDFNNLLGVIIGYSELVSSELAVNSASHKRVEAIKQAGQRAAALTTQLLAFSRKQTLQPRVLNLNSVVTDTEKLLRPLLGEDIECAVILDPKLGRVRADSGQIVQVIMNLAVNSRDAMPKGGKLIIETANAAVDPDSIHEGITVKPGFYVTLAVRDTGTGMDEETRAHIFEPFYTTKPLGKGTGLGLATVYGIVEQSGGSILVDTSPRKGTTVKIYLPRIDEVAETPAVQVAPTKHAQASGTILLVEDEIGLSSVVSESLQQAGYKVLLAANGVEALQVAERYQGPILLLITDVIMPFMSGPELAQSLKKSRPETRVLYISGYTADKIADYAKLDPDLALLQKPFKLGDLAQKVHALIKA